MRMGTMIGAGLGALLIATGVGAAISASDRSNDAALAGGERAAVKTAAATAKTDCRIVASNETGFDPARVSDIYSSTVNEAIFERLLTYDYLARPAKHGCDEQEQHQNGDRCDRSLAPGS